MHFMRKIISLVENSFFGNPKAPRLWIAPSGAIHTVDISHSLEVAGAPALFGLDQRWIERVMGWWEENDIEPDYTYFIVLAQENGWVRVSGDAANVAISGGNRRMVQYAARRLVDQGHLLDPLAIEIDRIEQRSVTTVNMTTTYYSLSGDQVDRFLKRGILPDGTSHTHPLEMPSRHLVA